MKTLVLALWGIGMWLTSFNAVADVPSQNRALVIVLNMYTADRGWILDQWYLAETKGSAKIIQRAVKGHYQKVIWLYRNRAQYSLFKDTLVELERDPTIEAIDALVYVHGEPDALNFIYDVDPKGRPLDHFVPTETVAQEIRSLGLTKLRAMFSDACYSGSHRDTWLEAGFKVAAGAVGVDSNQGRDVGIFFRRWVAGQPFKRSVRAANRELTYRLFDLTQRNGNSFKVWRGNGDITISDPVRESH